MTASARQSTRTGAPTGPDFFVSYTQVDRPWAEWVAWQLREAGYCVFLQAWDIAPGRDFVHEMDQALRQSRRVLPILSPEYLDTSSFGEAEWRQAFAKDPTGRARDLIPVRVVDCSPRGLLSTRVYIDLVGRDEGAARDELLAGVEEQFGAPTTAPPFPGARGPQDPPFFPRGVEGFAVPTPKLSADVILRYRDISSSLHHPLQGDDMAAVAAWMAELDALAGGVGDAPLLAQARSVALAMLSALRLKHDLAGVDLSGIPWGRLVKRYNQAVGDWPEYSSSLDALLVEAQLVSVRTTPLSPAARFMLGVLADARATYEDVAGWLVGQGFQLPDVEEYYEQVKQEHPAWLVIDLGPDLGDGVWPDAVRGRLTTDGTTDVVALMVPCEPPGAVTLLQALRSLMHEAAAFAWEAPIEVDIVAPEHLLLQGLEHWEVVKVAGRFEPLTYRCAPRLRWSPRLYDPDMRRAVVARARTVDWGQEPTIIDARHTGSRDSVLHHAGERSWLVYAGSDVARNELLTTLLREGYPYLVWRRGGLPATTRAKIVESVVRVSDSARALAAPEAIRRCRLQPPPVTILWDHPQGRHGYKLPSLKLEGPTRGT